MALDARDHRVETGFAPRQTDSFHHLPHEIRGNGERRLRRLAVDGGEQDRQEGGNGRRLPGVEIRVEVEFAVANFREQIHAGLAFRYVEGGTIESREAIRYRLELLRIVQQGLHLFLASKGAESAEHSRHRRRERRVVGFRHAGDKNHGVNASSVLAAHCPPKHEKQCRPERRQRSGPEGSRAETAAFARRPGSPPTTALAPYSATRRAPIPRSFSPQRTRPVSASRSARRAKRRVTRSPSSILRRPTASGRWVKHAT